MVMAAGEQVWHCGECIELDEVQGPGSAEQEVPLSQALQAEGHSQAGRCQRCRHKELGEVYTHPD